MTALKFWHFDQNNSGGIFDYDPGAGISHHLLIEAATEQEAKDYFRDIVSSYTASYDCNCCGDRWSAYTYESFTTAQEWLDKHVSSGWAHKWMTSKRTGNPISYEAFAHYADGRIEGLWPDTEKSVAKS